MPPPGALRTSFGFRMSGPLGGPMAQAFQPAGGIFSPGLPMAPSQGQQPVRATDFPVGFNSFITPREGFGEIHSFASLRAFANVELVRLAIETCKDQIERLDWAIRSVGGAAPPAGDGRIAALTRLFRKPDGATPFATWLRILLDDLLVLDAPAIEIRRDRGGRLIGLDYAPGETFKLLVDETGRRPKPPVPAYQQIIKGTVWADLTTDDLIYAPRNPRPNHLYGFSPVEQIIVTINTAMRRQGTQLAYFTEGNTPAGILTVPAGWGPDAIQTMQDAFDARMEGSLPGKSRVVWAPAETRYQPFKEHPLKDDFDEWLARVVCFAFSLPPTAFVRETNRATAETAADTGKEEGVESRKLWWKRIADSLIQEEFGYDDLEWGWIDASDVDPMVQAQVDDINLKNGSASINEVRDGRGLSRVEGGDLPMVFLPSGPVPLARLAAAPPAATPSSGPLQPPVVAPAPAARVVGGQPPPQGGEAPDELAEDQEDAHTSHRPNMAPRARPAKLPDAPRPAATAISREDDA